MPLPVIHSFAGYSLYRFSRKSDKDHNWHLALLCILLANLADFDFLPGIFVHQMGRFHHGASHSIGAALICGLVFGLFLFFLKKRSFFKTFFLCSGVYLSHIALDFFGSAVLPMPLFWPLSSVPYGSQYSIFAFGAPAIQESGTLTDFLWSMMSPAFLKRLSFEVAFVFLIWSIVGVIRELKRRARMREATVLAGIAVFVFLLTFVAAK